MGIDVLRPFSVVALFLAAVGLLASLATILSLFDPIKPIILQAATSSISINLLLGIGAILVGPFLVFAVLNAALFRTRAKLQNANLEMSTIRRLLERSEAMRMTDVVTGIPNEEQFLSDLARIAKSVSYASPFQMIFIDLCDFGLINKKFGYVVGDEVIAYFARSVHDAMRRNESFYKLPYNENLAAAQLWQRAYRKYTGGDEFIFIIGGSEADALGFLVRLQRRVLTELNHHIQTIILGSTEWSLRFSAAIIPIYPNDTKDDVFQRAHEGMRVASQKGARRRAFWASKALPEELEDGWKKRIYQDAAEIFEND